MPRTYKLAELERKFEKIRGIAEEVRPIVGRDASTSQLRFSEYLAMKNTLARILAVLDVEVE